MEMLGRVLLFILIVIVLPAFLTCLVWHLTGLVPQAARDAIMTLMPYGMALAVWALLMWLFVHIFAGIVD